MLLLAGALPCLVALLKSADHGLQHQAVQVLRQLTVCREENVAAVISAGVLFCMAHECLLPVSKQFGTVQETVVCLRNHCCLSML